MENRFLDRASGSGESKLREVIKAKTLLACRSERSALTACFRNSWFGWCSEEQRLFWECYNKEKEKLLIQINQSNTTIPSTHWDDPDQKEAQKKDD